MKKFFAAALLIGMTAVAGAQNLTGAYLDALVG